MATAINMPHNIPQLSLVPSPAHATATAPAALAAHLDLADWLNISPCQAFERRSSSSSTTSYTLIDSPARDGAALHAAPFSEFFPQSPSLLPTATDAMTRRGDSITLPQTKLGMQGPTDDEREEALQFFKALSAASHPAIYSVDNTPKRPQPASNNLLCLPTSSPVKATPSPRGINPLLLQQSQAPFLNVLNNKDLPLSPSTTLSEDEVLAVHDMDLCTENGDAFSNVPTTPFSTSRWLVTPTPSNLPSRSLSPRVVSRSSTPAFSSPLTPIPPSDENSPPRPIRKLTHLPRPQRRFKPSPLSVNLNPSCTDNFVLKNLRLFEDHPEESDPDGTPPASRFRSRYRTRAKSRLVRAEIEPSELEADLGRIRAVMRECAQKKGFKYVEQYGANKRQTRSGAARSGAVVVGVEGRNVTTVPTVQKEEKVEVKGAKVEVQKARVEVKRVDVKRAKVEVKVKPSPRTSPRKRTVKDRDSDTLNQSVAAASSRPTKRRREAVSSKVERLSVAPSQAFSAAPSPAATTRSDSSSSLSSSTLSSAPSSSQVQTPPMEPLSFERSAGATFKSDLRSFPSQVQVHPSFPLLYRKFPNTT